MDLLATLRLEIVILFAAGYILFFYGSFNHSGSSLPGLSKAYYFKDLIMCMRL